MPTSCCILKEIFVLVPHAPRMRLGDEILGKWSSWTAVAWLFHDTRQCWSSQSHSSSGKTVVLFEEFLNHDDTTHAPGRMYVCNPNSWRVDSSRVSGE